ncbi:MAG: PDZ domain-containing protein, partial [bacterium]
MKRFNSAFCATSITLLLLLCISTPASAAEGTAEGLTPEQVLSSLVKIIVQSNPVDLLSPWQNQGVKGFQGSGVIIDGNRILTAAHVIEDAVSIEVKRQGQTRKYEAEVSIIGDESDLAILTVSEPNFFKDAVPIPLGKTPKIEDAVKAYGFPEGGDSVSATSGIVSRIELSSYVHSWRKLLIVQIDAAINDGNSGGPIVSEGKLAGIAMQTLTEAENIGYIIPAAVIDHFLQDVKDGNFDGFPRMGITIQSVENKAQRENYGLAGEETGVLVTAVSFGSSAYGVLQKEDILLEIDGVIIAEDKTVKVDDIGRIGLSYKVQSRQVGESVSLKVLRDGKRLIRKVKLKNTPNLVPGNFNNNNKTYFIIGGLVFQPATIMYGFYSEYNFDESDWRTLEMSYYTYFHNLRTKKRDQLILLSKVLPASINRGYRNMRPMIVTSVQGQFPKDMKHLVRIIEKSRDPHLKIITETGEIVIIDLERAR